MNLADLIKLHADHYSAFPQGIGKTDRFFFATLTPSEAGTEFAVCDSADGIFVTLAYSQFFELLAYGAARRNYHRVPAKAFYGQTLKIDLTS